MKLKSRAMSVAASVAAIAAATSFPVPAQAQTFDAYLGGIFTTSANFCPLGSAEANGALLDISQNQALFALLGTMYGGDGQTTFAVPDLRGRVPVGDGNRQGLTPVVQGELAGTNNTTLVTANMPAHNHAPRLVAEGSPGTTANPTDAMLTVSTAGDRVYGPDTVATEVNMNAKAIQSQNVGGNSPFSTMQPYLGIKYCITTEGIFPSRP